MYCKKTFDIRKQFCQKCKSVSDCQTERLMQSIFGKDYKRTKVAENDNRKSNTGNK